MQPATYGPLTLEDQKRLYAQLSTADLITNLKLGLGYDTPAGKVRAKAAIQVLNERGQLVSGLLSIGTGGVPVPVDLVELSRQLDAQQQQRPTPNQAPGMPTPPAQGSGGRPMPVPSSPLQNPLNPPSSPQVIEGANNPPGAIGVPTAPPPRAKPTPQAPTPDELINRLIHDP